LKWAALWIAKTSLIALTDIQSAAHNELALVA
jgi:hypothetical protein